MDLATFDGRPFAARRQRAAALLGGQAALWASGRSRSRNYAANTFAFRGSSHFLYLFGWPLREAYALWDGQSFSIYARPPGTDSALWNGPEPTFAELEASLGVPVRSTAELPARARALGTVATLPLPDLESCAEQAAILGRPVLPGKLSPTDAVLADTLISLRLIHDNAAVAELRRAAEATRAAHAAGMGVTRVGLFERDVRATMEAELTRRGMGTAYGSIVTVHGEILHNEFHGHRLESNDLLLADVGAETAEGWAGDVTRTWPVAGRYSTTQAELYDVVLAAQKATVAAVRPGVRYRALHTLASETLAKGLVALGILRGDPAELVADGVLPLLFPHGIGHLLGLDVHDMEDLGDRAGYAPGRVRDTAFGARYLRLDRDLQAGMCVTIEPGFYVVPAILDDPKLGGRAGDRLNRQQLGAFSDVRGIRIEDDVLVTERGHDVLSAQIVKERAEIERLVGTAPVTPGSR